MHPQAILEIQQVENHQEISHKPNFMAPPEAPPRAAPASGPPPAAPPSAPPPAAPVSIELGGATEATDKVGYEKKSIKKRIATDDLPVEKI